jgi:UDP-glucose 4-epimerase
VEEQACYSLFQELGQIDGVIHFAALKAVGESVETPLLYYRNNLLSLINLLKCCGDFGIENFIFSSSCSLYGNVKTLPVNEDTPLSKTESPYAHTKLVGEEILRAAASVQSLKVISLRYFNPVGAHPSGLNGENPINKPNNLVPVITQTASGIIEKMHVHGTDYPTRDGSCIRDYIHVSDIADAHILALHHQLNGKQGANYEVFNLGTGQGVSVLEAIKAFEEVRGVSLNYELGPRRAGDVAEIYSDSAKAEQVLGWKPKFDLREMMASAWRWQEYLNSNS